MITTMKSFRPVKRNFASATAARNASTIESATVTATTIRLFLTPSQKNGRLIASRKWPSVACSGTHVGFRLLICVVRLERGRDHPVDRERDHDEEQRSRPRPRRSGCGPRRVLTPVSSPRPHHLADVDDAEHRDDQQHQDRDRGAAAEVGLEVALLVEVDAHQLVRRVDLRLADQQERLREDAEVPDDREARQDQQDRLQDRHRDVQEDAPRAARRRSRPPRRARAAPAPGPRRPSRRRTGSSPRRSARSSARAARTASRTSRAGSSRRRGASSAT